MLGLVKIDPGLRYEMILDSGVTLREPAAGWPNFRLAFARKRQRKQLKSMAIWPSCCRWSDSCSHFPFSSARGWRFPGYLAVRHDHVARPDDRRYITSRRSGRAGPAPLDEHPEGRDQQGWKTMGHAPVTLDLAHLLSTRPFRLRTRMRVEEVNHLPHHRRRISRSLELVRSSHRHPQGSSPCRGQIAPDGWWNWSDGDENLLCGGTEGGMTRTGRVLILLFALAGPGCAKGDWTETLRWWTSLAPGRERLCSRRRPRGGRDDEAGALGTATERAEGRGSIPDGSLRRRGVVGWRDQGRYRRRRTPHRGDARVQGGSNNRRR